MSMNYWVDEYYARGDSEEEQEAFDRAEAERQQQATDEDEWASGPVRFEPVTDPAVLAKAAERMRQLRQQGS